VKRKPSCCPGTDGTIVRHFRIEDVDAVIALWRRTEGVGLNESDTRPAIAAFLRRNPNLSFVAENDGRIIGAVLCGHDGRRGCLHHLAVSKRHRCRGVGQQLVNACLATASQGRHLQMQHFYLCQQRCRNEILGAQWLEPANGIVVDATPPG
jgi:ribosomal protein S18 acetylase RimI-like enzyme